MNRKTATSITSWVAIIAVFIFSFYLSSQRNNSTASTAFSVATNANQDHQEIALKQKLVGDFEIAFLKQYTPPVGCDVLKQEYQSADCQQHLRQSKNDFKDVFIKNRGLPKNTFEELRLSLK